MEHWYTFTRVIEAEPGAFNRYKCEQHRIGPCATEAEAWEQLEDKLFDTSDCRLIAVIDGAPRQTWSGSQSRRIAA